MSRPNLVTLSLATIAILFLLSNTGCQQLQSSEEASHNIENFSFNIGDAAKENIKSISVLLFSSTPQHDGALVYYETGLTPTNNKITLNEQIETGKYDLCIIANPGTQLGNDLNTNVNKRDDMKLIRVGFTDSYTVENNDTTYVMSASQNDLEITTTQHENPITLKRLVSKLTINLEGRTSSILPAKGTLSVQNLPADIPIDEQVTRTDNDPVLSPVTLEEVSRKATTIAYKTVLIPSFILSEDNKKDKSKAAYLYTKIQDVPSKAPLFVSNKTGQEDYSLPRNREYRFSTTVNDNSVKLIITDVSVNDWITGGNVPMKPLPDLGDYLYLDGTWSSEYIADPQNPVIGIICWAGDATLDDPALKEKYPTCTHGEAIGLINLKNPNPYPEKRPTSFNWQNTEGKIFVYQWMQQTHSPYKSILDNNGQKSNTIGYNNTCAEIEYNKANPDNLILPIVATENYQNDEVKAGRISTKTSRWFLPSGNELYSFVGNLILQYETPVDIVQINKKLQILIDNHVEDLPGQPVELIYCSPQSSEIGLYWSSSEGQLGSEQYALIVNTTYGGTSIAGKLYTYCPARAMIAF